MNQFVVQARSFSNTSLLSSLATYKSDNTETRLNHTNEKVILVTYMIFLTKHLTGRMIVANRPSGCSQMDKLWSSN